MVDLGEDFPEIDECTGCVKQMFADNWVDFVQWVGKNHPEILEEWNKFKEE